MMKKSIAGAAALASFVLVVSVASAHVTVGPKEVGVGKFQTFSVSVPVEREVPTVGLRLVLPDGLEFVSPTVKPGWKTEIKKKSVLDADGKPIMSAHGDEPMEVTSEIVWTGGTIPQGQRDDFTFSAKVPAAASAIVWKAYQTYQDGSTVSWELGKDQPQPQKDGKPDFSQFGPASETKIIDDLSAQSANDADSARDVKNATRNGQVALGVSIISLLLAAYAAMRKS
jgi:uncharacterized protein YcnI